MDQQSCNVVIIAEASDALTKLCGISLLERLLRTLERLDVEKATIVSSAPREIDEQIAQPSWARARLVVDVRAKTPGPAAVSDVCWLKQRTLILTAGYYDSRLLTALIAQEQTTLLVDSAPRSGVRNLLGDQTPGPVGYICEAALASREWLSPAAPDQPLFTQLTSAAQRNEIGVMDAARQPSYVASMRREIRPVWFPPPSNENTARAESLILDAGQNGTLDLPAIVHGPIETWIIRRLCRTSITPNQITLFTAAVSAVVAVLFASGHVQAGTLLALVVGVLDGVDGKQARVKVETTELGQREHALDYILELAWWTALAFHFAGSGRVPHAYALLLLLVGSDLIDRAAKKQAKLITGRNLDDVAPIDRRVRLIGGRRNIYIWLLAAGLLLRAPDKAYVALCWWGAVTTAVHVGRVWWISRQSVAAGGERTPH